MEIPEYVPWCSTGTDLGSGRQGNVCLVTCKNELDGAKYALKKLRNTDSTQARRRFQREIKAVMELNHSNIIRIFGHSDEEDDFQYYVMEYHEGAETLESITSSQSSNPFHGNVLKSLDLFEQLVSAIGAYEASGNHIVHRDISPKNILVLRDGTIRLIDFGICHFDDGMMITLADEGVGARNYTAPECESGSDDLPIGIHSDLYSAAKVLWSAITSQEAFAREQPVFRHRSMIKIFPSQTETWHLRRIFEMTIRGNPEHRFKTTSHVRDQIRELRYLIQAGYPPLEDTWGRCPSCGRKNLTDFPKSHLVFGSSRQDANFSALMCKICGFGFLRNHDVFRSQEERIRELT